MHSMVAAPERKRKRTTYPARKFFCSIPGCYKWFTRGDLAQKYPLNIHVILTVQCRHSKTLHEFLSRACQECHISKRTTDCPICECCLYQARRERALKYFVEELWDIYPFFHTRALHEMYAAASLSNVDGGFEYCLGVFHAVASLGALYLEDIALSEHCYDLAKNCLNRREKCRRIEDLIASIVLVWIFK